VIIQQVIKSISKGWKLILIIVLVAMAISLVISQTTIPTYRAQATFIIAPNKNLPSSKDVVSAFTALNTLEIFSTYADILVSERVYTEAIKNVDLAEAALSNYARSTQMRPESIILTLTVDGPGPETAAALTNEIGKYGIQFINAYFTVFEIEFLDQAVVSAVPFRPRTYRDLGISAGIGILVGLIVVLSREFMRTPINQFMMRLSTDNESTAFTKKYTEKSMVSMKERGKQWPIAFFLFKFQSLEELTDVLPGFSKRQILSEIVKRLRTNLKGTDLIARWDEFTIAVVLPNTPPKVSTILEERLVAQLREPVRYGVEENEQIQLDPISAISISQNDQDFETFIKKAEAIIIDKEW